MQLFGEKSELVKKKQLYDGVAFSPPPIHALSRVYIKLHEHQLLVLLGITPFFWVVLILRRARFHRNSTEWISRFISFVNVGKEKIKDELDNYLGEKLLPFNIDEHFFYLTLWKVNVRNYLISSRIAIQVTIVASETAFSTGGWFVRLYRNSLHPSTLETLMCNQSWIRGFS